MKPVSTQMASINLEMEINPPPVRQLPPPPRRHSGGSQMDGSTDSQQKTAPTAKRDEEEEGKSLIDFPKKRLKVKNGRSRPYYSRRCKRPNFLQTNINSLPDEIMFDILAHLPAQDIYGNVRPVCLQWYQVTCTRQFVNTHLQRSPYGFLLKNRSPLTAQLTFMALSQQGRIELTRLNYEPGDKLWENSCNGLILESEPKNPCALYITNPVTMQQFALPPISRHSESIIWSTIAYASLSMEYKVVRAYYQENQWYCAILTVGVDESWRTVRTQHLSHEAKELFISKPKTTEGFLHWAAWANYVLTLNVETEIITQYIVPSLHPGYNYFPTEKYLSLFIPCRGWSWEVWEMKPEMGEWTKLPGIELNDRKLEILGWCDRMFRFGRYRDRELRLVGWLKYKEVLVYRVSSSLLEEHQICIAWNVRSKKFEFIKLDPNQNFFSVHRNSLLWLDGCS